MTSGVRLGGPARPRIARPTAFSTTRGVVAAYAVGAICLSVGLFLWRGESYLNYAEGVYLLSSRMVLDGAVPYRDFLVAHPPLLYYGAVGVLALWDSLDGIRVLLAAAPLATGACVVVAVRRLTSSGLAAVVAGWVALVSPWALHEHATLTPETFGAPLVMAAAVLAARPRTSIAAGVVAGVAIGFKWPFILPGLALAVVCAARVRYLVAFAATFAIGVALSFALFGGGLYDQLVTAQQQVGWHTLHQIGGLAAQAGWNLVPLLVVAAFGVGLRGSARDVPQLRTVLAIAAANLVLVGTIAKTGTYINTIALAEPPLVALGAAGVVYLLRLPPESSRRTAGLLVVAAASALSVVQVAALLVKPGDPGLFVRPFSAPAHGSLASAASVKRTVAAARRCPPSEAYSGPPFYAFMAHRRMPGDEPDQFLLGYTAVGAAAARKAAADTPVCP